MKSVICGWSTIPVIYALRDHLETMRIIEASKDKAAAKMKYKAPHANRSGEEPWKKK